ncbi:nitroreductase family protein [Paenibacillus thalictri]|uniref:Nitroreductase n=1 Tax=Paenibacillus thalictri TaxID=2527873 RepID=A0A4Q9DMF0_9BACL|nr:nitroreductase family protein [Paenibacillus thalictri]TBL75269.1 nitroreductase [Paenibacillus thalictri]
MSTTYESSVQVLEQVSTEVEAFRRPDYPVSPLFINRWSQRAYTDKAVDEETLNAVLEAGRWAPSASNLQPWRFIVAKTPEQREKFGQFINPNNRTWADHAPVLILLASNKLRADGELNGAHAFDTGAAWASIALQAKLLGLSTRAMGGFDRAKAREVLQVPDEVELHAVVALGYPGDKEQLPEALREREQPNGRRPLAESVIEGSF